MNENWINDLSTTPKYKQIINSIISDIELGHLKAGDRLPSVNQLLINYSLSRDTIVKAYDRLKDQNIIESVTGKGYYIKNTSFRPRARVFLLFNKLSAHKKLIYDSFVKTLSDDVVVDFFIYNNDYHLFKKIILSRKNENYSHFAIIAHFADGGEDVISFLNEQIPIQKLVILDKKIKGLPEGYSAVFQDFEQDIYQSLHDALALLSKYKKIKLLFPNYGYHPIEIIVGFQKFCSEYAFDYTVVPDIESEPTSKGEVYITLVENDLVTLIKKLKKTDFKIGKDIGIISYNETPLKEILLDGISVISTDFEKLGETAANLILKGEKMQIANPFSLVLRNSL
jgi:DNA-binding transcriptional regulator YhcF (GntR family)